MDQVHDTRNARCLTCSYILYGLPEPVCPECGRAFDPSDESTFDTKPPGWRNRRRMKRVAIALAMFALLFALAPRGILKGQLTFVCNVCGEKTTSHRRELKAPSWMLFRYPSWHWTNRPKTTQTVSKASCVKHVFDRKVAFDLYHGGIATANRVGQHFLVDTLKGRIVTIATSDDVLRHLMSPTNNGVGP